MNNFKKNIAQPASPRRGRDERVNFERYQLISQGGEPVELIFSISILESYVFALNIAEFMERSPE